LGTIDSNHIENRAGSFFNEGSERNAPVLLSQNQPGRGPYDFSFPGSLKQDMKEHENQSKQEMLR
jgi:hypothetical protein